MIQNSGNAAGTIANAYKGGRWVRGYIKGKLSKDPVFSAGLDVLRAAEGDVLDLGCGLGLFGMWLRAHGIMVPYRGCDLSAWKIQSGKETASRLGLRDFTLQVGNITDFPLDGAHYVCVFDVLHYLPAEEQSHFVQRLADAAKNGASILLRTGVRGCGWRSYVTLLEECWVRSSGWIRGGKINFPDLKSLIDIFERSGCLVQARPLWGRTPFSSFWLQVSAQCESREQP